MLTLRESAWPTPLVTNQRYGEFFSKSVPKYLLKDDEEWRKKYGLPKN